MAFTRRKKASYSRRKREAMKVERDTLSLEYLRCVRDVARAKISPEAEPFTVYSSSYFPILYQFRERLRKDGSFKYEYNKLPMPKWNDLLIETKVSLFQFMCEEWNDSLYAFHIKIHPDLICGWSDKVMIKKLNKRVRVRLNALGNLPSRHFFIVEAHSKEGEAVAPHIHGMAMVEDKKQALELTEAMRQAAGQSSGGRGRLHKGSKGEFCYFKTGKSFPRYMLKHTKKGSDRFGRKPYVFSRSANQMTRGFYEFITCG